MLKELFKSFFQLSKQILFKQRPDVIFYYPQHFNRSSDGSNPYFTPLINICIQNRLNYLVLEEPCIKGHYPSNPNSIRADAIYWATWFVHLIMIKLLGFTLHKTDKRIGKLIDLISCHQLRARTYITISNSMIDVLGEINPKGVVYDLQHGIIYYGHPGYFLNLKELRPEFLLRNRRVLLWGNLYKNNLMNLPNGVDPDEKFLVIGYPMYKHISYCSADKERIISISLQFTSDISPKQSVHLLEMLDEFIDIAVKHDYKIILKHHPRFRDEVDLEGIINKYNDYVTISQQSLAELSKLTKLHVTWSSTTTMEFAAYGVPTLFLYDHRFDWASSLFYGQFSYPLYKGLSAEQVLCRLDDISLYKKDIQIIKEWYESAYTEINEKLILDILRGNSYEK